MNEGIAALAILLLSFIDAINTLYIIGYGGEELNPLMEALIEEGVLLFILVKLIATMLFLDVLVWFNRLRELKALLIVYSVLMLYQLLIIWSIQ